MAQARKSDIVLLALVSCVWGAGCTAIKYTQDWMGPVVLNLWTLGISLLALFPFAYAEYRRKEAVRRVLTVTDYLDYIVMGLVGLTSMTLLYTWGARLSLASNLALVTTAVPILTALIAVIVLRERLTRPRVIGFIIAMAGVLIISDIQWGTLGLLGTYLFGNLLLTAGAVGNAIYVVYSKKLLNHSGPMTVLFWGQALGFIGSLPFLYLEPFKVDSVKMYTLSTWAALIFLGAIFYAYVMVIFYRILVRLDAGQIMVFAYLQPVFGIISAAILLHERITVNMVIGGLLVVAGTLVVALERPAPLDVAAESALRERGFSEN
jgi:drug/metabolite transporter (DMT)-like permease